MNGSLKLRELECAVIRAESAGALQAAVTAFLKQDTEREYVETRAVGELAVMILYTE